MTVLAIAAIDQLPLASKGNRWASTAICLHTSYMLAFLMKDKSAQNVIQAYLSGVLAHKDTSAVIQSENSSDFKNKVLNEACDILGVKRLFSNPFYPQGNAKVENVHNFLK